MTLDPPAWPVLSALYASSRCWCVESRNWLEVAPGSTVTNLGAGWAAGLAGAEPHAGAAGCLSRTWGGLQQLLQLVAAADL